MQPATMTDAFTMYWHALWFQVSRVLPTTFVIAFTALALLKFHRSEDPDKTSLLMNFSIFAVQFIIFVIEVMAQIN